MGTAPVEVLRKGHIFLGHAGADTQAARQFAEILRRNGLDVWFDKDNLQPGDDWMATLERAISDASSIRPGTAVRDGRLRTLLSKLP